MPSPTFPGQPSPQQVAGLKRSDPESFAYSPMWPSRQHLDVPAIMLGPDGRPVQNPRKDFQKVFWARVLGQGDTYPIALTANGTAFGGLVAQAEENLQGDMEFTKWLATSTGRFGVEITQVNTDKIFQNNPIPNNCIFGTSNFPFYTYETIYLPATNALRFKFSDYSGAPNNVSVVGNARRFLDYGGDQARDCERRRSAVLNRRTHPYWLTWDTPTTVGSIQLTANQANVDNIMSVPDNADFECWAITDDSDGDYNIEVYEGRSSREIMDGPISARDFFAASTRTVNGLPSNTLRGANTPFQLPFTHIFKRNTKIRIRTTDTSGSTNNIRLVFHGRLIYYPLGR